MNDLNRIKIRIRGIRIVNNLTNNSNNVETADPIYDCPRNNREIRNREIRLRNLFPKIFILFIMFSLFHFFIISKMSEAITLNTKIGIVISTTITSR